MGQAKHYQMEQDDKYQIAIEIAKKVGLIEECEIHCDVFFDPENNNFEDAHKLANTLITNNDPLVKIFKGNRKELTDMLKNITSDQPSSCSLCDRRDEE